LNNNIEARPIIWIDDDKEDLELFENVFRNMHLKNPIIKITESDTALHFLKELKEQPFVIICDINMPKISGIELRKAMLDDKLLKIKSIPFIFFSTSAVPATVLQSYELFVQGYFVKPTNLEGIKKLLLTIIQYWTVCQHPNFNELFY
jgi:CheY-like chemotaxis protein